MPRALSVIVTECASRNRVRQMTEQEWLACADPWPMLDIIWGKASDRKQRLFACACCRRVWHKLEDERSRQAVIVAERYADGSATEEELEAASGAAHAVWEADPEYVRGYENNPRRLDVPLTYSAAAYTVAIPLEWWGGAPAFVEPYRIILEVVPDRVTEATAQCALLREMFGNPFHPVVVDPSWLTSTVLALARQMYDSGDFSPMPILADALQDAGCGDDTILAHSRGPGPHVRGCWVVDALLGKA